MENDEQRLMSGAAWREWCDRLKATGESILAEGFPASPHDRAEGFRWLTRLVVHAAQMEMEAGDTRHPFFIRYETPHNQWGGPNPDNVYLRANVDPSCTYRIWADVTGVRQAIFSLNEGEMQLGELGVFAECSLDDLEVGADGRLEIWLSPDEQPGPVPHLRARLRPELLATLPERLRSGQGLFDRTGGIHAAGRFDETGKLISVREDVGRHNAVDKVVGHAFLAGDVALTRTILMVSGRTSFEILQKALAAGVPVVAAVGAPSSLAVDLATTFNITLLGFTRSDSFNVYAGPGRILG